MNAPKILVTFPETVVAELVAASLTSSRGVAGSTLVGVVDAAVDSSTLSVEAAVGAVVVSSTTGVSLSTADMIDGKLKLDEETRWLRGI